MMEVMMKSIYTMLFLFSFGLLLGHCCSVDAMLSLRPGWMNSSGASAWQEGAGSDYAQSTIHRAASSGNLKLLIAFLQNGDSINKRDNKENTSLIWAASMGRTKVVNYLLEHNALVNCTDNNGNTALSRAAFAGHEKVVDILLQNKANVNERDNEGRTPISWAVSNGYLSIAARLLEAGAQVNGGKNQDGDWGDNTGRTPMAWAVLNNNFNMVQKLLGHNPEVNVVDKEGKTPLSIAAQRGYEYIVAMLLPKCTLQTVNLKDKNGKSPLHWAAGNNYSGIATHLLNVNAGVNATDFEGFTPLMRAAIAGASNSCKFLLEKGSNVNVQDTIKKRTALHWVLRMRKGTVKKDAEQLEPRCVQAIMHMLFEYGINPFLRDNRNKTAYEWIADDWEEKELLGAYQAIYTKQLVKKAGEYISL